MAAAAPRILMLLDTAPLVVCVVVGAPEVALPEPDGEMELGAGAEVEGPLEDVSEPDGASVGVAVRVTPTAAHS